MTNTKLMPLQLAEHIYEDMQRLTRLLPIDKVEDLLRRPLLQMAETAIALLPSTKLAGDGVALSHMVLVTDNYICEVKGTPQHPQYDIIDRGSVTNIRVEMWTQEIREGETVKATFYLAKIVWLHNLYGFATESSFAGESLEDRDEWVDKVFRVMPASSVLRR